MATPDEQEVTLIRPHTHNGIFLPAGEKIIVTSDEADWLKKYGVIADVIKPKQA
jgi:hypothetical protein